MLGPFEARGPDGRAVQLEGSKQRALLAVLALNANEVISADRLIESLWGEEPPPTAPKMVQVFISRVRRTLTHAGVTQDVLLTRRPGYVLELAPEQLDLRRFEALAAQARSEAPNDPAAAAATFRAALAIWRGPPLADLAFERFAQHAIPALDELRMNVLEERLDADLGSGRHHELIGELRELIVAEPLRERRRMQLILALYRSGRQAEALEAYRDTRRTLSDELGIEPGPELRRLEAAILRHDPALELPRRSPAEPARDAPGASAAREAPPLPPVATVRLNARFPRSRLAATAGLLASAVIAALIIFVGATPKPPHAAIRPNSVAVLDPRTSTIVGDIAVGVAPGPVAVGNGYVWVGNANDRTITKVDPRSDTAVATFGLPSAPVTLAAGAGTVWIGNAYAGTLSRILVPYNQLSAPFFPGAAVSGLVAIAATTDDLWVGLGNGDVLRLDPSSLRVKASTRLAGHPNGIVVVGGAVWIIRFVTDAVIRADLKLRSTRSIALAGEPQAIAADGQSIWVATSPDDRLWRIDSATGNIVATIPLGDTPTAVQAAGGTVWVAAGRAGVLEQIDSSTNTLVRTIKFGHPIGGLAHQAGRLWLTFD